MTDWYVGNTLTGSTFYPLPVEPGNEWEVTLNGIDYLKCVVPTDDPDIRNLNPVIGDVTRELDNYLIAAENGQVVAGGPITRRRLAGNKLTLNAAGMRAYLARRQLLPVIPFGTDLNDSITNTTIVDASIGDIARAAIALAQSWPRGDVPIVLPPAEGGTHTRTWFGIDLRYVDDVLNDLMKLADGVDIMLTPRWELNRQSVVWDLRTGTTAQPDLVGLDIIRFDTTVPESQIGNIDVDSSGATMTDQHYASSGKSAGLTQFVEARDNTRELNGKVLLQSDSNHPTDSSAVTLGSFALDAVTRGRTPAQVVEFDLNLTGPIKLGTFGVGDYCNLITRGHALLTDGPHELRILSIKKTGANQVHIVTGERPQNG